MAVCSFFRVDHSLRTRISHGRGGFLMLFTFQFSQAAIMKRRKVQDNGASGQLHKKVDRLPHPRFSQDSPLSSSLLLPLWAYRPSLAPPVHAYDVHDSCPRHIFPFSLPHDINHVPLPSGWSFTSVSTCETRFKNLMVTSHSST